MYDGNWKLTAVSRREWSRILNEVSPRTVGSVDDDDGASSEMHSNITTDLCGRIVVAPFLMLTGFRFTDAVRYTKRIMWSVLCRPIYREV